MEIKIFNTFAGFPGGSVANAGDTRDMGLNPGSERSPGVGNVNALWYSRLGNPMDRGIWWATVHAVAKNQSEHTHTFYFWKFLYYFKWQSKIL